MALFGKKKAPVEKKQAVVAVPVVEVPELAVVEVAPEVEAVFEPEPEQIIERLRQGEHPLQVLVVPPAASASSGIAVRVDDDRPAIGSTIIVEHEGTKHEAVVRSYARGCHATLKDSEGTPVFVATWKTK